MAHARYYRPEDIVPAILFAWQPLNTSDGLHLIPLDCLAEIICGLEVVHHNNISFDTISATVREAIKNLVEIGLLYELDSSIGTNVATLVEEGAQQFDLLSEVEQGTIHLLMARWWLNLCPVNHTEDFPKAFRERQLLSRIEAYFGQIKWSKISKVDLVENHPLKTYTTKWEQMLPEYLLGRRIDTDRGKTAPTQIYLGFRYQNSIQEFVAIKRLVSRDPDYLKRFPKEVSTLSNLGLPGTAPPISHWIEDDIPHFSMKLLNGGTLKRYIQTPPLSIQEIVALLGPVFTVLQNAHEQGVVHRDIKPSNIMFDRQSSGKHRLLGQGNIYLVDFGIAIQQGEERLTETGLGVGTPGYMAPEQMYGGTIDSRTDQYSLAVVIYELLTGRLPFEPHKSRYASQQLLPIAGHDPLNEALTTVLSKALDFDAEQRFTSALEFQEALQIAKTPTTKYHPESKPLYDIPTTKGDASSLGAVSANPLLSLEKSYPPEMDQLSSSLTNAGEKSPASNFTCASLIASLFSFVSIIVIFMVFFHWLPLAQDTKSNLIALAGSSSFVIGSASSFIFSKYLSRAIAALLLTAFAFILLAIVFLPSIKEWFDNQSSAPQIFVKQAGIEPMDGPDIPPKNPELAVGSVHDIADYVYSNGNSRWYLIHLGNGEPAWVYNSAGIELRGDVALLTPVTLTPSLVPTMSTLTPSSSPTDTPSATPTPSFTPSPSPTPTYKPTDTPTPTSTITPTWTQSATQTATPTPTLTATPTPPDGFCLIKSPDGTDFIIHCESIRLERQPVATMAAYCQDLVNQEGASQYTWQMQSASHLQTASEYQASAFVIGDTFELVRESEGRYCTLRPGEFCTEELFDGSTTFPQRIPFRCVGTINMP